MEINRQSLQPFKSKSYFIIPSGLTFGHNKFFPQGVFMCFVWTSENNDISQHSINRLVFTTETQCLLRGTN